MHECLSYLLSHPVRLLYLPRHRRPLHHRHPRHRLPLLRHRSDHRHPRRPLPHCHPRHRLPLLRRRSDHLHPRRPLHHFHPRHRLPLLRRRSGLRHPRCPHRSPHRYPAKTSVSTWPCPSRTNHLDLARALIYPVLAARSQPRLHLHVVLPHLRESMPLA